MKELELKKPDETMKNEFLLYNEEWENCGENMDPVEGKRRGLTYDAWLKEARALEEKAPEGMVTTNIWFLMREGRIIGAISLRHSFNDYLKNIGGHIGYGVRPSERGKGYADLMLKKVLVLAKERGMKRVLITCNQGNIGSAKVIIKNGGIFENSIEDGEQMVDRYWIDLSSDK